MDSCYGKCGDRRESGGLRCYCDAECEAHGDCCLDRHEWCAPSAAKPVCALVDDSKQYSRVCGTDLGFSFVHQGKLEILFGDSFHYDTPGGSTCSDPGVLSYQGSFNDDAQAVFTTGTKPPAWLPPSASAARPTGGTCAPVLDFDRSAASAPYTFTPITLRGLDGRDLSLGLTDTPLAGFSDGKTAFALFGRGPAGIRRAYVARRDPARRTAYHVVEDLGTTTPFHNPTTARVRSLQDYTTPEGDEPSTLLLWGRPRFGSTDAESAATNGLYLSQIDLPFYDPSDGSVRWAPRWFSGLDPSTGAPRWSTREADAVPMLTSDFKLVNQLDIKWVAEIGKWVMLYGGDSFDAVTPRQSDQPRHGAIHMRTAPHPWGPWSRPTPLLWREHMPWYIQCDAYDDTVPRGCDRKAPTPPYYPPGDWEPTITEFQGASCRTDHPKPAAVPNGNGFPFCLTTSQRGFLYAAQLLPTWTRHTPADPATRLSTTTLYFVVSTWYPYYVVLAAADLKLPDYRGSELRLQLRDHHAQMVAGGPGAAPALSRVAGGPSGGPTAFHVRRADAKPGPLRIGDTVVLTGAQNERLLGRVGNDLRYLESGSADAAWVLESAAPTAPRGTQIVPGVTPFRLLSASSNASSPARLISAADGLRIDAGPGPDAVWTFTDGCAPGDTCVR